MKFKYLFLICPAVCFAISGTPVQQISSDLGVTPQQFEQCMKSGKPATGGETDKTIVVQCLQKINPSITLDQLKSTIMKYRPNKPSGSPNQN